MFLKVEGRSSRNKNQYSQLIMGLNRTITRSSRWVVGEIRVDGEQDTGAGGAHRGKVERGVDTAVYSALRREQRW